MKFAKFAFAAAGASLMAAPAVASDAVERSSAPAIGESEIGGQAGLLVLFALVAVIIGFVADSDGPTSP